MYAERIGMELWIDGFGTAVRNGPYPCIAIMGENDL
jgi:hypothetical protein